jgi:hypothetical protein
VYVRRRQEFAKFVVAVFVYVFVDRTSSSSSKFVVETFGFVGEMMRRKET